MVPVLTTSAFSCFPTKKNDKKLKALKILSGFPRPLNSGFSFLGKFYHGFLESLIAKNAHLFVETPVLSLK